MAERTGLKAYPPIEERINIWSHALGLVLSVIGLFLLFARARENEDLVSMLSFMVFGVSMVLLYAASTLYHSAKDPERRFRLKVFDHAAIYVLIAGSYTPFVLITLSGTTGWIIFGVVWAMAVTGISLKLFFTGKYTMLSTIMYVAMGWIIIFAIGPLIDNLSADGLFWLFGGGLFYTLGAVLFSIHRIPYNHAVFHIFVLLGSFSHFIAIYEHVLP